MALELEALLALDAAQGDRALSLLQEAAAIEEGLPFEFGPPASLAPPHELLGEAAMELQRYDVALRAFHEALDFTPERAPALEGLAEAARAAGRSATAADAEARLRAIRHRP